VRELKTAIKATIAEIKVTKAALKEARDSKEIDYLRAKKVFLVDEKLALREELASACTISLLFFSEFVFKLCSHILT
jgi:hypothetical protein